MKILAISDTHRSHVDFTDDLSDCDLVVHSGDADCFDENTYVTFKNWSIKVAEKTTYGMVFVPGNHDSYIARDIEAAKEDFEGSRVHLLIDETIELGGLKIHGSPTSEAYGDLYTAFAGPASELHKSWEKIPANLDILITHGPPKGILDCYYGSESLLESVREKKPRIHIYGHIHDGYGYEMRDGILYVNAAIIGGISYGPFVPIEINYDVENRRVVGD